MGAFYNNLASYFTVGFLLALRTSGQGFLSAGCQMDWEFNNGLAQTYCNDHVCNRMQETSLSLDLCIGSVDGVLTPQKFGYFGKKCSDCGITTDHHVFECTCEKDDGTSMISGINMTNVLYNWWGFLSCFDVHQEVYVHDYPCKEPDWRPDPMAGDSTCLSGCPEVPPSGRMNLKMPLANTTAGNGSVIHKSGPRAG
ncbi:hypothetical protein F5B20DRAFT_261441 [Whalleya microplaca]|nr:hypothetical protein F5B20DRAFT_261441 [Whalleya microplaca]